MEFGRVRNIVLAGLFAALALPSGAEAQTAAGAGASAPDAAAPSQSSAPAAPSPTPKPAPPDKATATPAPAKTAATAAAPSASPPTKPADAAKAAAPPAKTDAPPPVALAAKALEVKAGRYRLDPDHGHVTWSVNHLGFSTFTGQFTAAAAELTLDPKDLGKSELTATVDTGSVASGNARLDTELKGVDWFDTKTYGEASFKAKSVTVIGPQTARIDGDLTLHGKTAPIVISATFNNAGVDPVDKQYTVGFDAAAIIRRSTFGLTKFLPLVGDNVTLHLEGEFKPVAP
jgi:polyisoprenoid-binding protein YceI